MSITTDNLAEFVDRLADLKRVLAQLNDAGTADRHLIGLRLSSYADTVFTASAQYVLCSSIVAAHAAARSRVRMSTMMRTSTKRPITTE